MLLAIDAGNTNVVFAVYDGSEQKEQCRTETDGNLPDVINMIAQKYPDIGAVIISSVVPKVNDALEKACQYILKIEPVFISHENVDLKIAIDKPEELGADRIVDAIAVRAYYQTPAVIVDFGTATTFDVIDADGTHCGGVIAPGVNLSMAALHQAAAQLPDVKIEQPLKVIGTNTVDAMQSGIYWGYIGLIEGTIQRIAKEMNLEKGAMPFVIATGGLASLFSKGTDKIDVTDPDLIMKGLVHIHETRTQNEDRKTA